MTEMCRMWHEEYGACELPFRHDGPHGRTPGGSREPVFWDRSTCACKECVEYEDERERRRRLGETMNKGQAYCSCGARMAEAGGIGYYCTRTGRDADCMTPDPVFAEPKQKTILEAAQEIVHGPRRQAYGHPTPNHQRIADLWNGFLAGRKDAAAPLTPTEVVLMMLLLKIARLQETPQHADSWQDIAGYAACGAIIEGVDPS